VTDDLRRTNQAIARNYDAVSYDPAPLPLLDVKRVFAFAGLFGKVRAPRDVLDLGCGTGVQLQSAGSQVPGLLVGADLSGSACERARSRLESFGSRAVVHCADLQDLVPDQLGDFDLIYCIGVIFITPPPVRAKILDLIGRCLRPGGVAVISYYAGGVPALQAEVYRTIRRATAGLPRQEAIRTGRAHLDRVLATLEGREGVEVLRAALDGISAQDDLMFFHQALNGDFASLQTSALEQELAPHHVSFATYLPPVAAGYHSSSRERAIAADLVDFSHGQYRYAIFAKDQSFSS
jgi:SAM-dependent methyltransferase